MGDHVKHLGENVKQRFERQRQAKLRALAEKGRSPAQIIGNAQTQKTVAEDNAKGETFRRITRALGITFTQFAALPQNERDDLMHKHKKSSVKVVDKPATLHTLKRKPHERKMCGFRVSSVEMAELEATRKAINKADYARGTDPHRLKHPFTFSDIFRGAVLALVAETAARDPDWTGIIADIRESMP